MFGRRSTGGSDTPAPGSGVDLSADDPAARRRLADGVHTSARWTLRLLIIAAGLWVLAQLFAWLWPILLPVLLALVLSSVLWPPVRWMRRKLPPALAAALGLIGLFALIAAAIWLIVPVVTAQAQPLANQASAGLASLQTWLSEPPFNLDDKGLGDLISQATSYLQDNAQTIATTALTSLAAIGSLLVTVVLALILTFFMLKDGPKFLPWLERWVGVRTGYHLDEVAGRVWSALAQYIWSQAAVAAVDGIFIGLGVFLLGVPLALPIGVITFLGGFIPIVGAFVAGGVAVLVALVSNGVWTAFFVLLVVLAVQQIEGNVLQPILVGKTLKLNAAVVIAGVTAGGSLFGIIGAFLAVPVIATSIVIAQYLRSQVVDEAPPPVGTLDPDEAPDDQPALDASPTGEQAREAASSHDG
ncbi:AI-2E family transporter [Nakamurella flavida]|uniref:AI-2E family transporter n=1 Tax=Nakamurella flavida TaxID=363630 RepID=A0A939C5Q0_9ACTN|nr:AI-2E family transporter [Nakamurella flavida]MBM9476417.1 AI-2E family transporter [Nakamurella flavida]MDP9779482.1 putative PurR-regulated permease PerM [Nakamurella flavida]